MNLTLWILQSLAGLLYLASGVMKVFMFDQISQDVKSFGALPKQAWTGLGIVELACVVCLFLPLIVRGIPFATPIAAGILAAESLIFVAVHAKYQEYGTIGFCIVLGLTMAFIAYGRFVLSPLTP
ncbi:MAG: DoxX family protein [Pirellulales bacterium]